MWLSHSIIRRTGLTVLAALVSACGLQPDKPGLTPILTEMAANASLQQWQIRGKIGLRLSYSESALASGHSRNSANSALINWLQCRDHYQIAISSPFGQRLAELKGDAKVAELSYRKQVFHGRSAEQLLRQHLGWSLPMTELPWWLRGLPVPDEPVDASSDQDSFTQNHWLLSYPKTTLQNNLRLPAKVKATHAADEHSFATMPAIKVTMVVKQWQLQPDCST